MKDTRKRSDKCEGSNLSNTRNETNILAGNTFCLRNEDRSRKGLSETRINSNDDCFTNANERVTDFAKMRCQNEKTYENNLYELTCDEDYAKRLILHPTILHTSKDKQVCHRCKTYTGQQTLTRISQTSSTSITESTINDSRHRRTLNLRHKMPDWVKAMALLFILFLSSCNASPANRDSTVITESDIDNDDTTILSNGTGLSRIGRSSTFKQHTGTQRLYNNFYGFYLEVKRNGKVGGTRNRKSQYIDLRFISLGKGRVALYFPRSGRYLAGNKKRLYSVATHSDECCTFKESYDPNDLHFTYELASPKPKKSRKSKKHRYIALRVKTRRKSSKCKAVSLNKLHRFALFQKVRSK